MKTSTYKYFLFLGFFGFFIACSTKKNSFINRNYHAVTTEYNVLYNGNLALTAGLNDLKTTYRDDYWDILSVERMQPTVEEMEPTDKRNANFQRAEEKATKAIQKHSMNISGNEKNPQMDEAHLLLGQARYYDNRFIPALEAFNYILYKHPQSDKIYEAKVWREKTNLRLNNEGIAIKNLNQLLKEQELDEEVSADANATLAQAYINTEVLDSAAYVLKKAVGLTKDKEKKARYRFILGQLYGKLNMPDSAFAAFQSVIDMKRKSPRVYVIQAHAMQAGQFDYEKGDTLAFMEKYRDLLEDRENRPYLDVINHQVGLFYDRQDKDREAEKYYNRSLRTQSQDRYLRASNYRNIAEMHFENAKYQRAGLYYDSTMTYLNARSREFKSIKKKRDNLADVIKYEGIAQTNDSILRIVAMPEAERVAFFEEHIEKLKKQDELERERLEAEAQRQLNASGQPASAMAGAQNDLLQQRDNPSQTINRNSLQGAPPMNSRREDVVSSAANTGGPQSGSGGSFYFYTPSTVAYGKLEFKKRWGTRPHVDNWRLSSEIRTQAAAASENGPGAGDDPSVAQKEGEKSADERYNPQFYISQLPASQAVLDSLAKERNFAYYQLGIIYKEKFQEYHRAADKLEKLLVNNPEERLILPSKYNLYKIYQIIDPAKAEIYKQQVLTEYPDSRYAEIIRNPGAELAGNESPEAVYAARFKAYESGQFRELLPQLEADVDTYTGEDIVSKFELLKARVTARLKGPEEYKKALNYVALTYPNSEEGKEAEAMLKKDVPMLESLAFGRPASSWKIVFKFEDPADPRIQPLREKIEKYIHEGLDNTITLSNDIYTTNENFLVIHGFHSKLAAQDAVSVLKDYKKYRIAETPVIISTEDYTVVQIKKNFTEFLAIN